MSKFKVGDRVTITKKPMLGPPADNGAMREIAMLGGEHVVEGFHDGGRPDWVRLKGHRWVWNEKWLEHAYEYDSL